VADAEGPLTRSRIEAFDQTAAVLADFAAQWRAQAEQLLQAANVYVEQVNNPNGTEWSGQTATSYLKTAHADRLLVLPAVDHANAMADVAELGNNQLLGTRAGALEAIAAAENEGFTVGEDLSVTDSYARDSAAARAARQAAVVTHHNYIAHHASRLQAENVRISTQLHAGAAQLTSMTPAHWRQPTTEFGQPSSCDAGTAKPTDNHKSTIHAVGNHTFKENPPTPTPPKPDGMSRKQAVAGLRDVNQRIEEHNKEIPEISALPPHDPRRRDFTIDTNLLNSEKESYLAVLPPQTIRPSEVIGPGGVKLPGVPPGLISETPADNGNGWIYPIAPNQPGIDPRVEFIRVMEPSTTGPYPTSERLRELPERRRSRSESIHRADCFSY
jgi:hypothetical protein